MQKFDDVRYTPRMATEKVKLLRHSWEAFMTDPSEYVNALLEVIPRGVHRYVMCSFMTDICMFLQAVTKWSAKRASRHRLSHTKYGGARPAWGRKPCQIFDLVQEDVLYQCRAFKRIEPKESLSEEDSLKYMTETWRKHKRDLRHFTCCHCRQYAKVGFCSEVSISYLLQLQSPSLPHTIHDTLIKRIRSSRL